MVAGGEQPEGHEDAAGTQQAAAVLERVDRPERRALQHDEVVAAVGQARQDLARVTEDRSDPGTGTRPVEGFGRQAVGVGVIVDRGQHAALGHAADRATGR